MKPKKDLLQILGLPKTAEWEEVQDEYQNQCYQLSEQISTYKADEKINAGNISTLADKKYLQSIQQKIASLQKELVTLNDTYSQLSAYFLYQADQKSLPTKAKPAKVATVKTPPPAVSSPVSPTPSLDGWSSLAGVVLFLGLCFMLAIYIIQPDFSPDDSIVSIPEVMPTEEITPIIHPTEDPSPYMVSISTGQLPTKGIEANSKVITNAVWDPYIREIDGVLMALVPKGCFHYPKDPWELILNRTTLDREPEHCFYRPFWIDVFEVTNSQYGSSGKATLPQQPRDSLTWAQAQQYCSEVRNGRLPTAQEWTYAAAGPSQLIYAVVGRNSQTYEAASAYTSQFSSAVVGSFQYGYSWVGAADLTGNLWEWTSTPHTTATNYIVKGGSWRDSFIREYFHNFAESLLAANTSADNVGFRCVKDYTGTE